MRILASVCMLWFCLLYTSDVYKRQQENWLVAANTTGATGGKMISPQSIAIATAACDMEGKDGEILRSAIPYALPVSYTHLDVYKRQVY